MESSSCPGLLLGRLRELCPGARKVLGSSETTECQPSLNDALYVWFKEVLPRGKEAV
jgi:hypothetical protein